MKRSISIRWSAIVCSVIALLLILGIHYLAQPAWSLAHDGFWWFVFGSFAVLSVFAIIEAVRSEYQDRENSFTMIHYAIWIITGVLLVWMGIGAFISSPAVAADTYKNTVTIEEGDFNEDFADLINEENYVFMDLDTAQRLGDRVLGSVPNATWYEIDKEYNLIIYQGRSYRISPLNYGGLFKYGKAEAVGLPGYVLVDCETGLAKFVETKEPMKYSPSAYFGTNLKRFLRGRYPDKVFNSHFFEIDEEGNPYWVTTISEKQAGVWGARKVTSFILTNAITGDSELYSLDKKPDWLDHTVSLEYMMQVAGWNYRYVNGWWNPSNTGVLKTTYSYAKAQSSSDKENVEPNFYGYNCFVNAKGEVLIFTGVTPVNKIESNVGFLTINAATGEYRYYNISGAEESSAQTVVEGLIQNMGYQATFPFMVNVAGHPTYLMNMKDKSGLIQRYAMVNLENYSQAFVGNTFEDTLNGYLEQIGETAKTVPVEIETPETTLEASGVILEKYQAELDGTTVFYYIIDDELYRASLKINESQILFKAGNTVELKYVVNNNINVVVEIDMK